ncbi:MAG: HEAT repeat domain-containing protein [Polyangiaceae bacterium]|nr:HEAT repeat domain-containing protein [Polyangiaceae bacterium]
MQNRQAIDKTLDELFAAERTARRIHDELSKLPQDRLLEALTDALKKAQKEPDEEEATLRLVRVASLLGELSGPKAVDALVDVLASDHPEARHAAGEELEQLAFERFKEVALGVERALSRLPVGSPALPELPYLLAEVPEPGVTKLLGMFLAHKDPDAVAAAIEALVEIGDPSAIPLIEKLADDPRMVEIADDGGDATSEVTLGELASEALDLLSPEDDGDFGSSGRAS